MAKDAKNTNKPVIIIKKVKAAGGDAHHGGAWKVAYADFVTAMMAFFLLLWLLNVTTDEQKEGIADYFAPSQVAGGNRGNSGMFGGASITSNSNMKKSGGATVLLPVAEEEPEEPTDIDEETLKAKIEAREKQQFEQAATELSQAIQSVPDLAALEQNLLVDQTPEGLRIQLVDRERVAMFEIGSAKPLPHTQRLLALVTQVVSKLPNRISVSGHTDATPYRGGIGGYSNWELSADRANASRRLLVDSGMAAGRIVLVQGKADIDPLIIEEPASPRNRRVSIVLLHDKDAKPAPTSAPAVSPAPAADTLRAPNGILGETAPAATPAR